MEFMWFQNCLTDEGLQPAGYLVDVHDGQEAIREAKQIATMAKPCTVVGLFGHEENGAARAICGWKKGESGNLKELLPEDTKGFFDVTKETFDRNRPRRGDLEAWKKLRRENPGAVQGIRARDE